MINYILTGKKKYVFVTNKINIFSIYTNICLIYIYTLLCTI